MKILLIEDNPAEQEFMRELIRRFQRDGLDLVIEDRLGKALPHFTNDGISAILLDLNLPDSRGLDTFTTAQRLASHIPIIILTGIEDDGLALRAVEGGAQDYLVKSQITAPVLEKAIQYAIERHRILRELKKAGSRLLRDEETLKEREQTLQTLLNAPMDTIALLDRKGTILEINQPGAVRFGRKREDLIGTSIYDLMPPDVARTRRQKHDLVFETGRPEHFGDERDGRYYASHVFPVFGPAGTGVHHLAIFASDITDLKKTEADLNASENLYKTVFEATGAATAIIDGNGTIIRANCETEALFGYSPAELQGKVHWSKFVPQDELPRLAEFWRLLHEDPAQSNQHYEAKLVDRYGRIKYGILSVRLIPRSENCVVSITDVTESRRADQAISESEERFRGLFDHMSSGVAVYQPIDGGKDFVFQDFNTAAEKIEGVNKKTLIGRRVTEAFPRVRQLGLLDAMQKVWETGTPEYLPPALYEDGGRPGSWRENWVYKLPNGELVAVYNDVTDRRAAEEALRKSEEKFRTVIENVPDLIMVHRDGIIRYINNAAIYTMDVPASSMLDRSIFDFIAPENHGQVRDAMKKRMAGEWIAPYEIEILTGSGRRTAIISGSQIEFEGGPATLNVLTDVTERRRAEREVLNLKQQMEFILGATKTGLDIIDSDFNIVYIDPEWARVYGSPAGRKCHEYFMDRDSVCPECGVVKAFETKRPVVTEERLLKENNRPIQVTTIPFQDEKGEWFVAEV
ncbi:MAG TPA: PAS domain S-box protein, partial [Methanomicrobiales archaeon]|nr:PAS domain S-box protein [Methanomicrobiales archaeon]